MEITKHIIEKHGLNLDEFKSIQKLLKRDPNLLELGIFSAMWNEHCSYKSSRLHLKKLPTKGKQVIQGPGENAGVIDIGDDDAIVFKIESHNHPSYIEPYQGAATGVGGILRDVFTMGARPIALLNSIHFGSPSHPKTKTLLNGVVSGIGGYGNCIGIPTVAGETKFNETYNENILVNAMAVGHAQKSKIFYSKAKGINKSVVYVGSKTGRDGIHGATMASAEFTDDSSTNRPQVQVGDPFMEKLLLESCLELMNHDAIIAIQDMGAAGLTSSSFEMASKGNCGVQLFLEKVPCREERMTPYEMMLSETQERMLLIIKPNKKQLTFKIFKKWGLDAVEIGKLTNTGIMELFMKKKLVGSLPIKPLAESSPEYDRPSKKKNKKIKSNKIVKKNLKKTLMRILSSPNHSSKKWIFRQYDSSVMGDTIFRSEKSDAAVVRIHGTEKAVAITCDCNPIYCKSNPKVGAEIAVAESWRNLIAAGANPIALTDNLNFGNPEKKEIMYEIKQAILGIKNACEKLSYPVVSGNVSLYNETNKNSIMPTPVIGGVGLIEKLENAKGFKMKENADIFLVGRTSGHLDLSLFYQMNNLNEGTPPKVDFKKEIKNGEFVKKLIRQTNGVIGCHDLSEGGVGLSLAELCINNNMGVKIEIPKKFISNPEKWIFGEDQSRYILIVEENFDIKKYIDKEVDIERLGIVKGASLEFTNCFEIPVKSLIKLNNKWFNEYLK